ncbi:hypothetical protein AB0F43_16980 [Kribbella sp. NPDC023972]|uniref:hypothetical protein n=1 Tax=Kribbella sp. NPDC023972 TaxID=3154795 RepID=UPI0033D7DC4B
MSEIDGQRPDHRQQADHGHGHGHGHGHDHDHDHEHGVVARWLGRAEQRVNDRLKSGRGRRLTALGLKAAGVTIRAAAFVVCPGDDIAAAAMPAVGHLAGHDDQHHHEESAVLPRQPVVVARLPMDRRVGGPDPGADPLPSKPVDADPAGWDVAALYQTFVVAGVAAPGSSGPASAAPGSPGSAAAAPDHRQPPPTTKRSHRGPEATR